MPREFRAIKQSFVRKMDAFPGGCPILALQLKLVGPSALFCTGYIPSHDTGFDLAADMKS